MKRTTNLICLTLVILVMSMIIATPVEARGGGRGGKGGAAVGIFGAIVYGIYYVAWLVVGGVKRMWAESAARDLARHDKAWSPDAVEKRVHAIYYAVQEAWGDEDMASARTFMTAKLLEDWQRKLDGNRNNHQHNVCRDIRLNSVEIVGLTDVANDKSDRLYVLINGSMIDYMMDTRTGEFIPRSENEKEQPTSPESFWELWTLRRGPSGWDLCETSEETGMVSMVFMPVECKDNTYGMKTRKA